jgi:RNA polymerase sigma-70 factor (TIGR02960 family)
MTDEIAFAAQLEPHRRELQVHCYRMLGSFDEAEDLVQETFLRAWRKRSSYEGRATVRAWLYKIATNACLDLIARNKRRVSQTGATANPSEVPWLEPVPDVLLDEVVSSDPGPEAVAVERETIELAYLVAIQHLPPRQRAALILRDVLGWSAKETAELLETSVASANSALQRARAGLEENLPANRAESASRADADEHERDLLARFMDAHESGDTSGFAAMLREDVRVTMPPLPMIYDGIAALAPLWERAFDEDEFGEWKLVATRVNRMPAAASYLRRQGETEFRAFKLDVLRVEGDRIAEMTTFGAQPFARLGLAPTL